MKKILFLVQLFFACTSWSQKHNTPFEKSDSTETTTYEACIAWYRNLAAEYATIHISSFGLTDAGLPLQVVLFNTAKDFDPGKWHRQHKLVVLINNGIHPGEPDGIDASMLLLRNLASGKLTAPQNIALTIIPIYNIGGSLNRNSFSRVNQDGPRSYGFRGNARNLDLNRDFIKSDSREARQFARIFQWLDPDILLDNHVSDGADYQYTMTLLTTQHNKLGGPLGAYLHDTFEPSLFKSMQQKNWPMTPYVNFEGGNTEKGWTAFYDPPRFSTGYAALFQTLAFMSETHMLKPFATRVNSTYQLMHTLLEESSRQAPAIIAARKAAIEAVKQQSVFPLSFKPDTSRFDYIHFMGYETGYKKSEVTGMNRMYYDRNKPFTKPVRFFNYFTGDNLVQKPKAYLIPQGWHEVIDLLKINGVHMEQLSRDTGISVSVYRIADYKTSPRAYEKHYRHSDVQLNSSEELIRFRKGDYIVFTGQRCDRFLVETLEPAGEDGYFAWNFFDAILQQKEGYSNYRWEDVAAAYLKEHPALKQELEVKQKADAKFAASASAQLDFVYKHSPYYEPAHLRYPVYRLLK